MGEVQHRANGLRHVLTYRPAVSQPLVDRLVTVVLSMLCGALLLGIGEVVAINIAR